MDALIHAARDRGFTTMEGLVLGDNCAMLRFAHALGFAFEPVADDRRTIRIMLDLRPQARRDSAAAPVRQKAACT